MTKKLFSILFFTLLFSVTSFSQDKFAGKQLSDGMLYGADLTEGLAETALANLSEGSKDQIVLVKGTITEVCLEMGCWAMVTDGTNSVRIVTKHKFFMPKDCTGKTAVLEGKFKIKELSPEDQMHYLEETGKKPEKPITETKKEYTIEVTGVKLLN